MVKKDNVPRPYITSLLDTAVTAQRSKEQTTLNSTFYRRLPQISLRILCLVLVNLKGSTKNDALLVVIL
jgi:hypothetical protein